jgi:two-component system, response regulator YesN
MYKVLIVEDEAKIREGLRHIVDDIMTDYQVAGEASNGMEALELLKRHVPDVLITDIRMPEMSGIDLIQHAREQIPGLDIVIYSGYGDFEYAKTGIKYGVTDYLLKPIDRVELIAVLERIKRKLELQAPAPGPSRREVGQGAAPARERHIIRRVKEIVADNLENEISLQNIAERVYLNHRYLSVLFKNETGQNFSDYVTELRMAKGKRLLAETNLKIVEIARLCGYSNYKYFMAVFKRSAGITPSEFRDTQHPI